MLTRRDFLKRSVVVVSAGLVLPPVFTKAAYAAGDALAADPTFKDRILVIVQMAGGNDGLNTVIPYSDGKYRDFRRNIGIPGEQVLALDDRVGLHPSLAQLKTLWDEGQMAIVAGVGYPNANLSHFRSMEIWQTASIEKPSFDGWLGRTFQHVIDEDGHLLDGVSVGDTIPMAMRSSHANVAAVQRLDTYRIQGDAGFSSDNDVRVDALLNLYSRYPGAAPYAALLQSVAPDAYNSSKMLQKAAEGYTAAMDYPQTPIGTGLKLLAQTIHQGLGIRVFHIGLGGFDTHANQLNTQSRLLKNLSEGLYAFYRDLQAHGKADDVMVLTWSEFGRRVGENANNGTDHGTAAPLFLLGGKVQRGLYGQMPSLTNLDNGNLKYAVDYRSVYASVLDKWMGAPADEILGGKFEQLGLVKTDAPALTAARAKL